LVHSRQSAPTLVHLWLRVRAGTKTGRSYFLGSYATYGGKKINIQHTLELSQRVSLNS
jgi:hypothetical protein